MYGEHLSDLDELVLRCRDDKAKSYIAEAVACYRAGAFRACIVNTWIAIVFDFIHKLRDLELAKNKLALEKIKELEGIQQRNDVRASLAFEREILDWSKKDFEFLSALEYEDLKRLLEDRNRCAHPSMQSLDEPYQPSAELARYHLKNAVVYFLQRPPVQGKSALDRIMKEIQSEYFPLNVTDAIEHFRHGPLVRANEPLVRGVIYGLTSSLILEHRPKLERARQLTALNAVINMYVDLGNTFLFERLPKLLQGTDDTHVENIIHFTCHISLGWDALGEPGRIKLRTFMETASPEILAPSIGNAFRIPHLKDIAAKRLGELSISTLAVQIHQEASYEFVDITLVHLARARSFNEGNMLATSLLLPLAPLLKAQDIRRTVEVFLGNDQLYRSSGTLDVIGEVFVQGKNYVRELKDVWILVYKRLPDWRKQARTDYYSSGIKKVYEGHALLNHIEETFPEVKEIQESDEEKIDE